MMVYRGRRYIGAVGVVKLGVRVTYDAVRLLVLFRKEFGDSFFTARDASQLLYITVDSAGKLLAAMARKGLLERREAGGPVRYMYRVAVDPEDLV